MARIALMQNVLIEYMGFMYLSSYLKERAHTVEMFIENARVGHDIFKDIVAFKTGYRGRQRRGNYLNDGAIWV